MNAKKDYRQPDGADLQSVPAYFKDFNDYIGK